MIDPAAADRLAEEAVIELVTTDGSGAPISTPVWFVPEADGLLVYSRSDARRVRHIPRRPAVTLRLPGRSGRGGLALAGEAVIDASLPPPDRNAAYVAKYRARIEGQLKLSLADFARRYPVPIRVRVTAVRAG